MYIFYGRQVQASGRRWIIYGVQIGVLLGDP